MAKNFHSDVLDGGLNAVKTGAIKMLLIKDYTFGDSYATVTGNKLAEVTMASADYTLASSGNNRTLTTGTKSATATGADAPGNHHIAFTDGAAKVLAVTDETGEVDVAISDTINFPAITLTLTQPA